MTLVPVRLKTPFDPRRFVVTGIHWSMGRAAFVLLKRM